MALNASTVPSTGGGPKQEPIAIGTYMARLVQVIDLGLQPQEFQGQQKAPKREINLTYELLTEFMKDADGNADPTKPRWIGEMMPLNNLTNDLAKSTKRITSIDAKGQFNGDLTKMVGLPCNVTVAHNVGKKNGAIYANVSAVTPPMAGIPYPELKNDPKIFDLDDPNMEVFLALPQFLQDKVKANLEFPGSKLDRLLNGTGAGNAASAARQVEPMANGGSEDDLPF